MFTPLRDLTTQQLATPMIVLATNVASQAIHTILRDSFRGRVLPFDGCGIDLIDPWASP